MAEEVVSGPVSVLEAAVLEPGLAPFEDVAAV